IGHGSDGICVLVFCINLREQVKAPCLCSGPYRFCHFLVPADTVCEALLFDNKTCLTECKKQRDCRGIWSLHRFPCGTFLVGGKIEIIRRVLGQPLPCPAAHRDCSKTCRGSKTFLGPGNSNIDTPRIGLKRVPSDRGNPVDNEECVVLAGKFPDLCRRVLDPGRGFVMHKGNSLCACLKLFFESCKVKRCTPVRFNLVGFSVPLADLKE